MGDLAKQLAERTDYEILHLAQIAARSPDVAA
jgi:hypothetical protein